MHLRRTGAGDEASRGAWLVWGLAAGFYLVALFHRMSLGVASLDAQRALRPGAGHHRDPVGAAARPVPGDDDPGRPRGRPHRPAPRAGDRPGGDGGRRDRLRPGHLRARWRSAAARWSAPATPSCSCRCCASPRTGSRPAATRCSPALTGLAGAIGQIGTTVPLGPVAGRRRLDGHLRHAAASSPGRWRSSACARVRDRPAGRARPGRARRARARPDPAHAARGAGRARRRGTPSGPHFGLMGPFVAITALWGYPYLVRAAGRRARRRPHLAADLRRRVRRRARRLLGAIVARAPRHARAACCSAPRSASSTGLGGRPCCGRAAARPGPDPRHPGHHRRRGGACAMLAFDVARAGNPAHAAGGADRARQHRRLQRGRRRPAGRAAGLLQPGPPASIQAALLPMLGAAGPGAASRWRATRGSPGGSPPTRRRARPSPPRPRGPPTPTT